jgi:hypothetical protein
VEIFKQLSEAVSGERPELGPTIGFSSMIMFQLTRQSLSSSFSNQKSITEMEHPPYSLDLAPNDLMISGCFQK